MRSLANLMHRTWFLGIAAVAIGAVGGGMLGLRSTNAGEGCLEPASSQVSWVYFESLEQMADHEIRRSGNDYLIEGVVLNRTWEESTWGTSVPGLSYDSTYYVSHQIEVVQALSAGPDAGAVITVANDVQQCLEEGSVYYLLLRDAAHFASVPSEVDYVNNPQGSFLIEDGRITQLMPFRRAGSTADMRPYDGVAKSEFESDLLNAMEAAQASDAAQ